MVLAAEQVDRLVQYLVEEGQAGRPASSTLTAVLRAQAAPPTRSHFLHFSQALQAGDYETAVDAAHRCAAFQSLRNISLP